jgi:hypothetical protein
MNKALKGYSKNRFYSILKNTHRHNLYMDNWWRGSCHSFIRPTIGTGDLIPSYVWDEKTFEKAMEKVRELRGFTV